MMKKIPKICITEIILEIVHQSAKEALDPEMVVLMGKDPLITKIGVVAQEEAN